ERLQLGGEGFKQGARYRGDWGDWQDVKPRRREALRQLDREQDRLRSVAQPWAQQQEWGGATKVRINYGSHEWG
ncbi:hypothetical protein A2U01_0060919, partial [Trifolium medium]|nr:hypothetical protein [Trifolium medium]